MPIPQADQDRLLLECAYIMSKLSDHYSKNNTITTFTDAVTFDLQFAKIAGPWLYSTILTVDEAKRFYLKGLGLTKAMIYTDYYSDILTQDLWEPAQSRRQIHDTARHPTSSYPPYPRIPFSAQQPFIPTLRQRQ